jgi:hypothetical protein
MNYIVQKSIRLEPATSQMFFSLSEVQPEVAQTLLRESRTEYAISRRTALSIVGATNLVLVQSDMEVIRLTLTRAPLGKLKIFKKNYREFTLYHDVLNLFLVTRKNCF